MNSFLEAPVAVWTGTWKRASARARWAAVLLSLMLGSAQMIGSRIAADGSLGVSTAGHAAILCAEILLASACFALLFVPVLSAAGRWEGWTGTTAPRGLWNASPAKRILVIAGILVVCWSVYWFVLWPGTVTNDSFNQLEQAMGQRWLSDHHPLLNTLIIKAILVPVYGLVGNYSVAISAVTAVQLVVLAGIYAASINALRGFSPPRGLLNIIIAFFALSPLFGWYSVTIWKDVWLTAFVLALASAGAVIVQRLRAGARPGAVLWTTFMIVALGVMFSKKTGIYLMVPMVLVVVCFLGAHAWKARAKWLAIGLLPVVLYLLAQPLLLDLTNAAPGSTREMFSVPSQQISRVVRDDPKSLSAEQRESIARFYSGKNLGALYDPHLADPVKNALDTEALNSDLSGYLLLWAKLGAEHPKAYLESFLEGTVGYWYPNVSYWKVNSADWVAKANQFHANELKDPSHGPGMSEEFLSQIPSDRTTNEGYRRVLSAEVDNRLPDIPVIGWTLKLGAWTWAVLICAAIAFVRRRVIAIPVLVLEAFVWVSCLISPVFAEARYAIPMLAMLPLLAVLAGTRAEEEPQR
ncbi:MULTISPECIES: DUF6020 family protein [unclassified Leucobacter]|uniref:DUF6020 family protein n=1 Tax=unclassified Leucobacter TaxID=2621730 RepID=UPI0012E04B9D|nr:DUF6020 family protein [Leucobacter sp. Ag1]